MHCIASACLSHLTCWLNGTPCICRESSSNRHCGCTFNVHCDIIEHVLLYWLWLSIMHLGVFARHASWRPAQNTWVIEPTLSIWRIEVRRVGFVWFSRSGCILHSRHSLEARSLYLTSLVWKHYMVDFVVDDHTWFFRINISRIMILDHTYRSVCKGKECITGAYNWTWVHCLYLMV